MGLNAQGEFLPRIAGRMLGLMIVEEGPHGFTDLAGKLAVTRASASTDIRLLSDMGLVERVGLSGVRQERFQLVPNPYVRFLERNREQARRAPGGVERAIDDMPRTKRARVWKSCGSSTALGSMRSMH